MTLGIGTFVKTNPANFNDRVQGERSAGASFFCLQADFLVDDFWKTTEKNAAKTAVFCHKKMMSLSFLLECARY